MGAVIDLTGQRFGRLVAERLYKGARNTNGAVWICECDCGMEVAVPSSRLRLGKTKSCGCLREMPFADRAVLGYWPSKEAFGESSDDSAT